MTALDGRGMTAVRTVVVEKFGGPEVLTVVHREPAVLDNGSVRIAVEAVGVNRADLLARAGDYHRAGPPPLVLGLEAAGRVVEVGSRVSAIRPGQRVIAWGAINEPGLYAEQAVVRAANVLPVPAAVPSVVAAALPTAWLSAWYCLHHLGHVSPGDAVVVHAAASGVGSAAIQIAADAGARVVALVGSPEKAAWVRGLGAPHVIDTSKLDRAAVLDRVRAITDGRGAEVVLDTVGGTAFEDSLHMAAFAGVVVALANVALAPSRIDTRDFYPKNVQISGFQLTALFERGEDLSGDLCALLKGVADGGFEVPVAATFDLADAGAAHELLGSRGVTGKVMLTVTR